ncbi:unnamed protein product, partial [Heterosigma akashiwo]
LSNAQDLYSLLGVRKQSTQQEIKQAYKKLAIQYHPDKNPGDESAQDRFIEIQAAYETLSDDKKRRLYDLTGDADGQSQKPTGSFGRERRRRGAEGSWNGEHTTFRGFSSSGRTFHFEFTDRRGRSTFYHSGGGGRSHGYSSHGRFSGSGRFQTPR